MTTATANLAPFSVALAPRPSEFLRAWFAGCPAGQLVELRAIRPTDHHVIQEFFTLDATGELLSRAFSLVDTYDCYFGVCPRIRPQGHAEDVTHAPGLWADLDFKRFTDGEAGARRRLAAFPITPTWIIASGGGFHLYWKLDAAVRWDATMSGRLRGIVKQLDADPAAIDRCRVLRIPGTFNHKYPDCQVRIVQWPS